MENTLKGSAFCCGSVRRYAVIGLALAGLGLAAGCDNPLACERLAQRERSFKWTADALAYRERQAPERLKRDLDFIKEDEQTHKEMFARDLCQIQARFDYDVQRWQDRQCDYLKYFEEMLRGKPEDLEQTAIILFY
jgi:hypothetical protein